MLHEIHRRFCSSQRVWPVYRLTCVSPRASLVAGRAEATLPALRGQCLLGGKASGAARSQALAGERAAAIAQALPASPSCERQGDTGRSAAGRRACQACATGHVPGQVGVAHGVDPRSCPELAGTVGAGQGLLQEAGRAAPVSALGPHRRRVRQEAPCWWPWPGEGCPQGGQPSQVGGKGLRGRAEPEWPWLGDVRRDARSCSHPRRVVPGSQKGDSCARESRALD